mgnify:FL=1
MKALGVIATLILLVPGRGGDTETATPTTLATPVTGTSPDSCGIASEQLPCESDPTAKDLQGIMARGSDGFNLWDDLSDLEGVTVCVLDGSIAERNLKRAAGVRAEPVKFEAYSVDGFDEVSKNFLDGVCDAITASESALNHLIATHRPIATAQGWVLFNDVKVGTGWSGAKPTPAATTTRARSTVTKAPSSTSEDYAERLARCYFAEERPGYDLAGGGPRDNAAMAVCLGRVKE